MVGTIRVLVSCQVQGCAEETSYPLDMVAMFKGKPICQQCYEDGPGGIDCLDTGQPDVEWADLPAISLEDLRV